MAIFYLDNTNYTSELTGTDWTFTNGSTSVSSAANGTAQTDGVAAGDYIRDNGGSQWYKVTAVSSETSITITPSFQQTTSSSVGVNWSDISTDNGTTTALAFCHPNQYTTDTSRSAGDIGKIRANQTHKSGGIDIQMDENGTVSNFITLKGCTSTDDPFSDSSDVKPIIDFGNTVNQFRSSLDYFWLFENLEVINSTDELFYVTDGDYTRWRNCSLHGGADGVIIAYGGSGYVLKGMEFYDNTVYNLSIATPTTVVDCTFNGGAGGTAYGINCSVCCVIVDNSTFGQTTAHSSNDLRSRDGGKINCRNCKFTKSKISVENIGGYIKSEDDQQVKGASWAKYYQGTIEKETTEVRSGGADNSVKVTPNSNCTTNHPFELTEWVEFDVPASSQTRSVYIEVTGISSTYPTNTELYFEAEYYSGASGTTKATQASTAVLAANSTWVEFPVTFTPGQTGKVRYRVYLKTHESSEIFYIDNQMN